MVYKPTRSQQFGVRPVGVSPATGLKDMAIAIGKVAQTSEAIRQHDRKMRFDQALLDAELAGKTAVKFDDDNKVIPITSMEYNPGMFYGADEAQVQSVFRKALIQTYKTAFSNDVTNAAETAAQDNFANPDGVKAIMEEYGITVENLPDELKSEIMPTYLSAFGRAERYSRSQLLDKVKKEDIASNNLRMNNIIQEKKHHYLITSQSGETIDIHHMDRLDRELGQISEHLQGLGIGEDLIADAMAKGNTAVASAAAEGHVIREYQANNGDAVATSIEIDEIINQLSGRGDNLNLQAIESNMRNRLSMMKQNDAILSAEETKKKKLRYDDYVNDIWIGNVTSDEQIDSFEDVDQAHRNALKSQLKGLLSGNKNEALANWNKTVKTPFLTDANIMLNNAENKLASNSSRRVLFGQISKKIKEGLALGIDMSSIHGRYLKAVQDFVIPLGKMDNAERLEEFKFQMSDLGGYVLHPSVLISEEFIDDNIKGGFFKTKYDQEGKAKSVFASVTVAEWKSMVLSYADKYEEFHKDAAKFDVLMGQLKQGLWGLHGREALEYLREKIGFGNLSVMDPQGGKEIRWQDAMFMYDRPDVQARAFKSLIGFATSHGVLPEDFALVLKGMEGMLPGTDKEKQELMFGTMQRAVAQIHESFKAKYSPKIAEDMTRSLLKFNDINYGAYHLAKKMGFENWTTWNARKNATQATSREISAMLPEGYENHIEYFDNEFQRIFQNWGWTHKAADWIIPFRQDPLFTEIRNSVKQIGTSNLDFVWNDPKVKSQIMDMSFTWLKNAGVPYSEDAMEQAIITSMSNFGDRIGIQEIEYPDGTEVAQVVVDPIQKEALKTIAPVGGIKEYVDFTSAFNKDPMKYIKQDFMHQWYSIQRAGPPDFGPNEDKIFFVPNTVVGKKNTWSVMQYDGNSFEPTVLISDYSYDFQKSIHSVAMVNAYHATKNATGLSKFFLHSGLFNTREMNNIMEKAVEKQLSPYDQTGMMVKFYNSFMSSMGSSDLIDMKEIREKDASQFLEVIKAIERNSLPGLFAPWKELGNAYNKIPEEIRGTWLSYGIQNQTWDEARKSIWK